jgi:hypothetical protein
MRTRYLLAILFVLGLLVSSAWSQFVPVRPVPPVVVAGSDVGFRIEGERGGTPVGGIVVKRNGEWVPVELAQGGTRPISQK